MVDRFIPSLASATSKARSQSPAACECLGCDIKGVGRCEDAFDDGTIVMPYFFDFQEKKGIDYSCKNVVQKALVTMCVSDDSRSMWIVRFLLLPHSCFVGAVRSLAIHPSAARAHLQAVRL